MTDRVCIHCYVSGKVQGVWFRATTKDQAEQRAITGWARNLPDGRVEVLACGRRQDIADLHAWLQQGPPRAVVTEVYYEELSWQEYEQFVVL
jgi:acylphosphatase